MRDERIHKNLRIQFTKDYMRNLVIIIKLIAGIFILVWTRSNRVDSKVGSETSAIFSGANLTGVILDGVIFCNTTMPDGRINNAGCNR